MSEAEETANEPTVDTEAIADAVKAKRADDDENDDGVEQLSEELVEADEHLARAAHRTARALERGLSTYRERQAEGPEAAEDRILEMPVNMAEGLAVAMTEASQVPVDLAKAFSVRPVRKAVKASLKIAAWPFDK